jgi:uncharacterized membrane protein YGL010W
MSAKKTADQWFAEYGESHQNRTNETIHWICVPVIFTCVLGFAWEIPVPESWMTQAPWFNWTLVAMALVMIFYVRLSPALSAGMFFFESVAYALLVMLELYAPWAVGKICVIAFMVAWTGQFIGHVIEGRRPSFFNDIAFLLIGPAWLMSRFYRKVGQKY